ncbi:MAG: glycoside hydrolase family 125 protein [Bacteroidales bacterium]|nr:glycoside hydrolase family 125 protein [Bacteroidales bacterium]
MSISRRKFLKNLGMSAMAFSVMPSTVLASQPKNKTKVDAKTLFLDKRPAQAERKFVSTIIEQTIKDFNKTVKDQELQWLFSNCFPNTIDTTVFYEEKNGKPFTYVITGDIDAMWLRDSSAQVYPYVSFVSKDKKLDKMIQGVINKHTECVHFDPYANAFNNAPVGSHWETDITDMKPELHERKWEIDSLCYTIRLSYGYWKQTKNKEPFDDKWLEAQKIIYRTFKEQQRKENKGPYSFLRNGDRVEDSQPCHGYGNPINPVGLIVSAFRPSDDATILPFLVPSNFFAVVSLRQSAEMVEEIFNDKSFASDCRAMAKEVEDALYKYAVKKDEVSGDILAFEVDGFGNQMSMDDGNIPNLLSLPYLGAIDVNSKLYQNTRKHLLSERNPYYSKGAAGHGVGGPHIGREWIWPMGIISQAFTSQDDNEIKECVLQLLNTHAGTGFMHESFQKDDASKFTRSWFAWANTLLGELLYKLSKEKPELLNSIR